MKERRREGRKQNRRQHKGGGRKEVVCVPVLRSGVTGGRKEGRLAGFRIRRIDKVTACVEKERKEKKRRLRMAILVQETVKERKIGGG